ncbi:MAG: DUF488 domain-containing protein [Chthoniobacter sp.]|uniref:DUF488 domain-containing protein n=1 Tax=Chthoniobacter sp. TaxID=2510640 RepID=UPI0032A80A63
MKPHKRFNPASERGQPALKSLGPVLTIGHSTRPIEAFIELLKAHGVECVADVRTVPRSRHNPQFDRSALPQSLRAAGGDYVHLPQLGGLRRTRPDSINAGWRNASFRGYADYMQTSEFEQGMAALIEMAKDRRVAIMCVEAVPWRCHRSLIADALLVRGIPVEDVMSRERREPHDLTPFAKVRGTEITYPAEVLPPDDRDFSRQASTSAAVDQLSA